MPLRCLPAHHSIRSGSCAHMQVHFAMTTMSTVGYGDVSPRTRAERLVAMVIMAVGERACAPRMLRGCACGTSGSVHACTWALPPPNRQSAVGAQNAIGVLFFGLLISTVGGLLKVPYSSYSCFQVWLRSDWA